MSLVWRIRQEYREDRSYADLALDFDAPAVPLDNVFADGKPQPGAATRFMFTRGKIFQTGAAGTHRESPARILNQQGISISAASRPSSPSPGAVIFDGIAQQVEQHLFDLVAVASSTGIPSGVPPNLDALSIGFEPHHILAFVEQVER